MKKSFFIFAFIASMLLSLAPTDVSAQRGGCQYDFDWCDIEDWSYVMACVNAGANTPQPCTCGDFQDCTGFGEQ